MAYGSRIPKAEIEEQKKIHTARQKESASLTERIQARKSEFALTVRKIEDIAILIDVAKSRGRTAQSEGQEIASVDG